MVVAARDAHRLTVIPGGRAARQRRDEAHIELLTLFAEVERAVSVIVNAITGLPVPSTVAIHEAMRLAYRAQVAREEWLSLTDPEGDAA